jgi:transcriptional regulator
VYVPEHFAETRPDVLAGFIRRHSFGTLVTGDEAGSIGGGLCATHLPFLFRGPGADLPASLISHMARQNDQWKALRPDREVLAIFQGPHAYVSPRYYVSQLAVPTWNYTSVHVYGKPRLIDDPAEVRQVLAEFVSEYEGSSDAAWRLSDLPEDFIEKMSRSIVAFAIDMTRTEGKFKLNQNRSKEDRSGVVQALEQSEDEDAREIAKLMRELQ